MFSIIAIAASLALTGAQDPRPEPGTTVLTAAPTPMARTEADGEAETRRVCRRERQIGSNVSERVCRDVPLQGFQNEETRRYVRENQRVRMPDL